MRPLAQARRRGELALRVPHAEGLEVPQPRLDLHQCGRLDGSKVDLDRKLHHLASPHDHLVPTVRLLAERSKAREDLVPSPPADPTEGPLRLADPVLGGGPRLDQEVIRPPRGGLLCADGEEEQKQHVKAARPYRLDTDCNGRERSSDRSSIVRSAWRARCSRTFTAAGDTLKSAAVSEVSSSSMSRSRTTVR